MKTTYGRLNDSWRGKTEIKLWDNYVLTITTRKDSRGIATYTYVDKHEGGFREHMLFQDYSKCWASLAGTRCTEKAIKTLHETSIEDVQAILFDVYIHYEKEYKDVDNNSEGSVQYVTTAVQ